MFQKAAAIVGFALSLALFGAGVLGFMAGRGFRFWPPRHAADEFAVPVLSSSQAVKGFLEDNRVAVFESPRQSCDPEDIPDTMARAFRDFHGTVHLLASHSVLRQSLGPALTQVRHSCQVAYRSVHDPDPAHHNDSAWLDSFYTMDGKNIVALAHVEYHGWEHPGMCHSEKPAACEFDADSLFLSSDGGYHFERGRAEPNYFGIPYRYQVDKGPAGYSVDTNIVKAGEFYYAMVTASSWPPGCVTEPGSRQCLVPSGGVPIRTSNLLDISAWRGWDGKDFAISSVDPYGAEVGDPRKHVLTPVEYMDFVTGLNVYQPADLFVATLWDGWDNRFGPQGLYLSTSKDMIHWTRPTLVVTQAQLLAEEPPGHWSYAYFSLLDPASGDANFSTMNDQPYLYYVRMDNDHSPEARILFRQRIRLALN